MELGVSSKLFFRHDGKPTALAGNDKKAQRSDSSNGGSTSAAEPEDNGWRIHLWQTHQRK
jgi:hypothetical protein